jgi:uncharacterized protein (TIGR00730 family)
VSVRRWCVFCGSSPGHDPRYVASARELGTALAAHGIEIVYGGGRVGMMGALADAALEAGGKVIGIIPHSLERREVAHRGITELRIVDSMHERKALMAELSEGFVALPGGFGTFEEFCEVDPLIAMFDRATEEGFISAANRAIVDVFPSISALLERLPAT